MTINQIKNQDREKYFLGTVTSTLRDANASPIRLYLAENSLKIDS
jgi:hypothetical protein